MVQEEMIGKTVMANYDNSRYWVIQEVVFDVNLDNKEIGDDTKLTLTEYYLRNYGLRIDVFWQTSYGLRNFVTHIISSFF